MRPAPPLPVPMALAVTLLFGACGGIPPREQAPPAAGREVADAIPRAESPSRYGNPESYVVLGKRYYTLAASDGFVQRGIASWYGREFHGRKTSSGEVYDMYQMTAAHTQLPLPSYVEVTNLNNGRSAIVKVNDRGPFHDDRVLDLSYVAARKLDMIATGTAPVEIRAIGGAGSRLPRVRLATAPEPAAAPELPAVSLAGRRFLQVAAFRDRANAEALRAKLALELATAARIAEAVAGDQTWYRVQIGPFVNAATAQNLVSALARLGLGDRFVLAE
ncbi:MAG: septal ring lytic transglycosylase RlpA family protein [Gammaproteobacteria bacterium]|nr:septal ring lytic transglycosylase RlpA family protein [Gammaproteobacteria bacterium]